MLRTQVYLTEAQDRALKRIARATGRSQSQLIRDAVDRLTEIRSPDDWKAKLLAAAGAWADRPEVEDELRTIREDLRRRHDRIERAWRGS